MVWCARSPQPWARSNGLVNNAAIGLDGLLATQHASDISRVLRAQSWNRPSS
jgi:hypothetical protein